MLNILIYLFFFFFCKCILLFSTAYCIVTRRRNCPASMQELNYLHVAVRAGALLPVRCSVWEGFPLKAASFLHRQPRRVMYKAGRCFHRGYLGSWDGSVDEAALTNSSVLSSTPEYTRQEGDPFPGVVHWPAHEYRGTSMYLHHVCKHSHMQISMKRVYIWWRTLNITMWR